ncbi:MAG: flagellar motor switch protein FliN [Gammaproteobacteria bacterium]|nr:MAG: flagellar motor switch protein FliN [Gammaproteobacteria bacterium]
MADENDPNDDWGAALSEQADAGETEKMPMNELTEDSVKARDSENIDVILDIPVTLSLEVGTTVIAIRNLLQLNQGSVIELDRLAGEALDVKVNNTLIAHGEVVVINEKYGIRLTDVMSPSERIQKLK